MDGYGGLRRKFGRKEFTTIPGHADLFSEQALRGGSPHCDQHPGTDQIDFRFEPGEACFYFPRIGFLVKAKFSFRYPFEMFYDICDIRIFSAEPCRFQGFIEHPSRRPDEGVPFSVFVISGLFADQEKWSAHRTFSKNRLGPTLP